MRFPRLVPLLFVAFALAACGEETRARARPNVLDASRDVGDAADIPMLTFDVPRLDSTVDVPRFPADALVGNQCLGNTDCQMGEICLAGHCAA